MSVETFLWSLLIILAAAKVGSEAANRLKQPAVLGELVAGIVLGGLLVPLAGRIHVLRSLVIDGNQPFLVLVGQLGVILLLFEAGLESDMAEFRRLGIPAMWVASTGVILPLGIGYAAGIAMGLPQMTALFVGGALTATSVGITARTFTDLRQSQTDEARTVMGAAVADDVLGLIVLAIISGLVSTHTISALEVTKTIGLALAFLIGSTMLGNRLAPQILAVANRMESRAALSTAALVFCLLLSTLAEKAAGLSPIVGAFAAGLVLARSEHRLHIEEKLKPLADIFIPVFFVIMGASMPIAAINPSTPAGRTALVLAGVMTVVAIFGKIIAGLSTPSKGMNRLVVGVGMIPRGEVGLIFAAYGIKSGVMDGGVYSALLLVVMVTTFMTPPLLKLVMGRSPIGQVEEGDAAQAPGTEAVPEPLQPWSLELPLGSQPAEFRETAVLIPAVARAA